MIVERMLYLCLLMIFILWAVFTGFMLSSNHRLAQRANFLQSQIEKNAQLSQAIKNQSSHNETLIRCVAQIFATYTQNGKPVVINDLDRCITKETVSPSPTQSPAKTSNSSQPAQASAGQGNLTPFPQNNPPAPKNCTIDVLGVHLLCP